MKASTRPALAFLGFAAIAAFLLTTEHRAHLFGALPWVFLLACPFLHLFMHGGHTQHQATDAPDQRIGHSHRGTRKEGV